ncbi:hypothetical protein [Pontivivens nitratireducens]|uniref:Uncharacterized protein n=1 Tax=Pontivivens nitratireducens TaxID=2758038 RepID=A0A6G7VM21_9RHOB|nr:hypothetical protein [Pontibrevibacter nitratireducens]QIK40905.1 hypothetical protein G8E03_09085 [Pontibrevibacter nitratireducens]
MTDPFQHPEPATEPADLLEHDLRRFLHNARDQMDALQKTFKLLASAEGQIKEQTAATKRIYQNLQRQIDCGVMVHVDADLKAHAARVANSTMPLLKELEQHRQSIREMAIMIMAATAASGLLGSVAGVFVAIRFL